MPPRDRAKGFLQRLRRGGQKVSMAHKVLLIYCAEAQLCGNVCRILNQIYRYEPWKRLAIGVLASGLPREAAGRAAICANRLITWQDG
jgi:hypothetical protein